MGLEPTTSSLGSVATLMGTLRKSLRFNARLPACFDMR